VGHTALRQGVLQGAGDGLLAHHLLKGLGTPLPGQDLVCHLKTVFRFWFLVLGFNKNRFDRVGLSEFHIGLAAKLLYTKRKTKN
jgi:hypothetical protein